MAATSSTHQFIEVKEIKDNVAILRNGGLRLALMVSSINFGLKSEQEQEAVIAHFQDFINSLDWSIEILVQSRSLDLSDYLKFLNERAVLQTNELLKIQTAEYVSFIQELVKLTNVMSKFFYVIVSVTPSVNIEPGGWLDKLLSRGKKGKENKADLNFETKKNELTQRADQITGLLGTMGLKALPLAGEELIELLYTSYNPGSAIKQKNLEALLATGDEAKKVE